MPLTNAHTTYFFEDAGNMSIWHNKVVKLQEEVIKDVDDL